MGSRGKTVRALTPTTGLPDASRFRTGGVRVTLFFVTEERVRGIIARLSCDEGRGGESDVSARFLGRKNERVFKPGDRDDGRVGSPLDFRPPIVPVDHSHATDAFDSFHPLSVPQSDP